MHSMNTKQIITKSKNPVPLKDNLFPSHIQTNLIIFTEHAADRI